MAEGLPKAAVLSRTVRGSGQVGQEAGEDVPGWLLRGSLWSHSGGRWDRGAVGRPCGDPSAIQEELGACRACRWGLFSVQPAALAMEGWD